MHSVVLEFQELYYRPGDKQSDLKRESKEPENSANGHAGNWQCASHGELKLSTC